VLSVHTAYKVGNKLSFPFFGNRSFYRDKASGTAETNVFVPGGNENVSSMLVILMVSS